MIIPKDKSKTKRKEELKEKTCQFPGCIEVYMGVGKSCFCKEHRNKKYRKIIDSNKTLIQKQFNTNTNQIIKHNFYDVHIVKINCECCGKEFEIKILPRIYVYPKYCEGHRNDFQRELYLRKLNETEK